MTGANAVVGGFVCAVFGFVGARRARGPCAVGRCGLTERRRQRGGAPGRCVRRGVHGVGTVVVGVVLVGLVGGGRVDGEMVFVAPPGHPHVGRGEDGTIGQGGPADALLIGDCRPYERAEDPAAARPGWCISSDDLR